MLQNTTFLVVLLWAPVLVGAEVDLKTQRELDSSYHALATLRGEAYLAARGRLLAMDKDTVRDYLRAKRGTTKDVVQGLCLEAVELRLKNAQLLDSSLAKALASAAEDRSYLKRNPYLGSDGPRPEEAGALLIQYLGNGALPFVTELLVKDLTNGWQEWQVVGLLTTLDYYRMTIKSKPSMGEMEYGGIKDVRAGKVLLWVAEHKKDDEIANGAAADLRGFASEELLREVEMARDRTPPGKAKERLGRAAKGLILQLQEVERASKRAATRPGSTDPRSR